MEMDTMWEKIKKGLRDGAVMSAEKIDEYAKVGKLKVDELSAKRKIDRNYLDLGERYYDLTRDGREASASDDLVVKKAVANINSLNADIAEIGEKIKEVQRAAKKDTGAADCQDDDDSGV
ncbi:MAG: hypothetical protein LBC70_05215 [Chitinispirillales bacterium]|jgi:hypothetical protein|nr:hypothetical protein [Chitinispirillales bacterium]